LPVLGQDVVGVNPKINNLVRSYRAASYDTLWILDSNALVSPGTLLNSVNALSNPRIGVVHHVPFGILPNASIGSRTEQAFLCTTHAKMYLGINALAVDSCLNGKSNLFRKSDLERALLVQKAKKTKSLLSRSSPASSTSSSLTATLNQSPDVDQQSPGLEAFGKYLGEDNMIGSAIWHNLGLRHALTSDVVGNSIGSMSFQKYFWRRVRWIRVRKYMTTCVSLHTPTQPPF
jgi:ceramide glucosyltransferase